MRPTSPPSFIAIAAVVFVWRLCDGAISSKLAIGRNQPCIERRSKTTVATSTKLGSNVGRMRGYIAGKFHRNRFGSFCAAVQ
jgi:hypothetical protein